jgi:hypothetical protein
VRRLTGLEERERGEGGRLELERLGDCVGVAEQTLGRAVVRLEMRKMGLWKRTDLLCALALDGDEEASTIALWVAQRCGEVRAAHDAELDVAILDERETDGVLLAAEEALGTVDRIEGPHACRFIEIFFP